MHKEITIPAHARLTVADDGVTLIQPHPSVPNAKTGYIVAKVCYSTIDGQPSPQSKEWTELIAFAVNEYVSRAKLGPRDVFDEDAL